MKCADPVLCYTDTKGTRIFRNFRLSNDVFKQLPHVVFNCGKCISCRKKRAYELASRCVLHASLYKENCFLTLTYDEKKEGYHNRFEYKDIQDFKKRLRSHVTRKNKKKIELFNVHEYGANGKKHWHLIAFNYSPEDKIFFTTSKGIPLYTSKELEKLWPYGFNTVGSVSEASAMYQAQYMEKDFEHRNVHTSRRSHSKHSGLGKPYFLNNYRQILELGFIPLNGAKLPIPRYFQKIAHKHFCHYYDQSAFVNTRERKALYRPFKKEKPIRLMADLYLTFKERKEEHTLDLIEEWETVISQYLTTKDKPDFIKSAENYLHDLRNKPKKGDF